MSQALAISKALSGPRRTDMGAVWGDVLKGMPLFADVPKRHVRKIASLTKEVRFAKGSTIVRAGDPGDAFFVILDGSAAVLRPGGLPAIDLGPGDYFGEIALIDGAERTATVRAQTEVFCLRSQSRSYGSLPGASAIFRQERTSRPETDQAVAEPQS
jgi:signal-transduction protein with cAMP-binding, CBS, and nucleotidyltransferase domain